MKKEEKRLSERTCRRTRNLGSVLKARQFLGGVPLEVECRSADCRGGQSAGGKGATGERWVSDHLRRLAASRAGRPPPSGLLPRLFTALHTVPDHAETMPAASKGRGFDSTSWHSLQCGVVVLPTGLWTPHSHFSSVAQITCKATTYTAPPHPPHPPPPHHPHHHW